MNTTKTPKTAKARNEKGIANHGSYRLTLAPSVAWAINEGRPINVPAGCLISATSGGWQDGLNATCVRGTAIINGAQTAIAYLA